MAMTMTSRQRVLAALHHEEPDRVPIFFGSSGVTTMNTAAYDRMKAHLGIKSETKTFWRALQYAILDEEVMVRFHSDARSLIPGPRLDGRRLGITGTVTAVNAAAGHDATESLTPDEPYRSQTSTNLQNWIDLSSFIAATTNQLFVDPAALNEPRRFYRAASP